MWTKCGQIDIDHIDKDIHYKTPDPSKRELLPNKLRSPSIPSITEIYGRIWVTSFSNVYSNYYLKKRQGEVAKINIQHLWA